ncbi:MAG: MmgE/PrpD family protein [Proteobacteria bacterium]|nr:MmgE/PrpD family protein [Pseudomonadota bacterium]
MSRVAAEQEAVSISHRLASHAATTPYAAIPADVRDTAKLYMLDTLAVAWAGSDAPGCPEAHALQVDEGGRADSTAWAYGGKLSASSAAFINGMSSSALDYDSLGRDAPVHVNIAVLPAALAVAEKEHASGADFLAALVVGSDIVCRLGAAAKHPPRGFHYTAAFGIFGAAAAAARLMRLDAVTTRHALGLAFIQAGGTQQANIEPSLAKRLLSAFAARSGVYAALLAQRGITAPAHAIEGEFGLYKLYQDGSPERLLDALGSRFDSAALSIKQFPSCGCNHTTIAGMLDLVRKYDLQPDDVESIDITVSPYMDRIVGMPYDPSGDAQVAAQFSIRYSAACVLVRRRLGLAEIQEAAARDPEINRHVGKVTLQIDPTLTSSRGPVVIRLRSKRHGELATTVAHVPGSREAPLTEAQVNEKFDECFRLGTRPLSKEQIATLTARVHGLEQFPDMASFFSGIC